MNTKEKVIAALDNIKRQKPDINKLERPPYYTYDQGRYEAYQVVLAWITGEEAPVAPEKKSGEE
jgi:hypothetical protein